MTTKRTDVRAAGGGASASAANGLLADLFGVDARNVEWAADRRSVRVGRGRPPYPVVDDVVILLPPEKLSADTRARIGTGGDARGEDPRSGAGFAADIQRSFGREWDAYRDVLPEHRDIELRRYFDLVDLNALRDKRLLDLGCGSGRWSALLAERAREVVLVDYSDAIFVARDNLRAHDNAVFFLGDITDLPFRDDCADLAFSLGVLQTLPLPCLDVTRRLARLAPELLVFVYYALDNRPAHWRAILAGVTAARLGLSQLRNEPLRRRIARAGAIAVYRPMIALGDVLETVAGRGSSVPLWDAYHGMSVKRIQQDVYDRFFTSIEQRVTRDEIRALRDTFRDVVISDGLPYWHFLCRR